MDKLLAYINSLPPDERESFASRCGASLGYLKKAISVKQTFGEGLCLRISIESHGRVMPEDLRPEIDWQYMRAALTNTARPSTGTVLQQGV